MVAKGFGLALSVTMFIASNSTALGAGLRAGFATTDITPPLGLELSGFGPYLERKGTAVHDPLMAHAVVFEVGGQKMAIVGCDLLGMPLGIIKKVRQIVVRETTIPENRIMVSATHTHSGPAIPKLIGWGAQDEQFLSDLPSKVAQAIITASKTGGDAGSLSGSDGGRGTSRGDLESGMESGDGRLRGAITGGGGSREWEDGGSEQFRSLEGGKVWVVLGRPDEALVHKGGFCRSG